MVCKNCGRDLPDDARICSSCGAEIPADTRDGPQDVLAAAFEQVDAERLGLQKAADKPETAADADVRDDAQDPPEQAGPVRKKHKGLVLLAAVLLIVLALVVVLVRVMPSGGGLDGVVYWTKDNNLMYFTDLKSGTKPTMLLDTSAAHITLSKDGNALYFMRGDMLYYADLTKSGEWNFTPTEVDSGVNDFTVLSDGGAVYRMTSMYDDQLRYYDKWESYKLVNGANRGYLVNQSEDYVYYYTGGELASDCWRIPLAADGAKEKLFDNFWMLYSLRDDLFVYSRYMHEYGGMEGLYYFVPGGEEVLLTEDASSVISTSLDGGKVTVVYLSGYVGSYDICKYEDGVRTVMIPDIAWLTACSPEDNIYIYDRTEDGFHYEWFCNVNGVESKFDMEGAEAYLYNRMDVLNGSEAVLEIYEEDRYVLKSYTIGETGLTDPVVIAEDYSDPSRSSMFTGTYEGRDVLYYFVNVRGSYESGFSGDLVRYCDGENTTIAKNAACVTVLADSDTAFALSGVDKDFAGTLSAVKDGERFRIADDVQGDSVVCLGAKRVLFVSDGDLYLWDGKDCKRLVSDVKTFWVPGLANAASNTYFCHLSYY